MNAWSHLPNAAHIDRVLESVKSHPEVWISAYDAARDATDFVTAWSAARDATDFVTAWSAARDAAWDETRGAARQAAWNAVLALITYDDAAKYLGMPSDQLKIWGILSEDPAAILLLPAVVAYEKIDGLETV